MGVLHICCRSTCRSTSTSWSNARPGGRPTHAGGLKMVTPCTLGSASATAGSSCRAKSESSCSSHALTASQILLGFVKSVTPCTFESASATAGSSCHAESELSCIHEHIITSSLSQHLPGCLLAHLPADMCAFTGRDIRVTKVTQHEAPSQHNTRRHHSCNLAPARPETARL